jgi:membrane associated rhomboid family serine protease
MIPLRDEQRPRSFPFITVAIVIANCWVFAHQWFGGPRLFEKHILSEGLIPVAYLRDFGDQYWKIFSAMFMHGGWFHLISNIWFLWVFGDNVEDRMGKVRYLIFYFLTGIISFMTHVFMSPNSAIPLIGASGAIAGVLGAYFLLFPGHRILTLIPIFIFFTTAHVPAAFFLGYWFLLQFLSAKYSSSAAAGGVAFWAHVGGFVAGLVLVLFFKKSNQSSRS